MANIYGITSNDIHTDVSNSERGAKNYATRNGYEFVSVRYDGTYNVDILSMKVAGKWQPYEAN